MPGCQPDAPGNATEELREIGLSIRPSTADNPLNSPVENDEPPVTIAAETLSAAVVPEMVPDRPPVELQLPRPDVPAVIGTGGPPRSVAQTDQILSPTRASGGGGAKPGAAGTSHSTSFLGIQDAGKRYAYVIDCSGSMADHEALRIAKSELMASLQRLNEAQQFQVIFANSEQIITLDAGRAGVFYGTDSQRLEVRLQIAAIRPDGGTNHTGALETALDLNPDVLFYLTDGLEPSMSASELARIRQRNRGTRIHTIEFGRGELPRDANGNPPPNFLTKLAAQNNGRSTYRDVTEFAAGR
jgi:hypothetical protein